MVVRRVDQSRAGKSPRRRASAIWGCGNFECDFPWRLLGNRARGQAPPAARLSLATRRPRLSRLLNPIDDGNWKARFTGLARTTITASKLYVTIDLDCLVAGEAVTNWENGRFTCDDLVWALRRMREKKWRSSAAISAAPGRGPTTQTAFQKLAGWFDHPKVLAPMPEQFAQVQGEIFRRLWPALTGTGYPNL